MLKLSHIIFVVLAAVTVGSLWYASEQGYRSTTKYTCVCCRVIKKCVTVFGFQMERVEETEMSRWYTQHQPPHTHQWAYCGTTLTYYPLAMGRGCGKQHPIWGIPPALQREFFESATPLELRSFLAAMDSADRRIQQQAVETAWQKVLSERDKKPLQ